MTEDNRIHETREALKHASWHGAFLALQLNEIRDVLADWYPEGPPVPRDVLNRIRAILDSAPPAPRVFFPGELIPGGMATQNEHGTITRCLMSVQSSTIEVRLKTAANRLSPEEWQATVDRAKAARADSEWQHTEGVNP